MQFYHVMAALQFPASKLMLHLGELLLIHRILSITTMIDKNLVNYCVFVDGLRLKTLFKSIKFIDLSKIVKG